VTSICVDNITPPVIPDVQVCVDEASQRAVILVHVHQSADAPHAINKNTLVYVRSGRQNDPEELANLERIAWIANRRQRSVDFREWLFVRASQRYKLMREGQVPGIAPTTEEPPDQCMLTLAVSPVYPSPEPLVLAPQLQKLRRQITVRD